MKGLSGPIILCLLMLPAQLLPAGHYGIFGDEMYFIACSKRLAFGFVDHPPLVDVLVFGTRLLFGDSIVALRFITALAGSATVLLSALFVFASAPLLYLFVHSAPALVGVRLYHGLATAIFGPVALAYVADLARERRAERMGWYSSATLLGRSVAPTALRAASARSPAAAAR